MKNLYVCEKCGKVFSEYDDAWACERSHATVDQIYSWDLPQNANLPTEFYAEGESVPEYIVMKPAELNEDGYPLYDTMPNGNNVYKYNAVVYKRVDKVKLPNGMTPYDYTIALRERQLADNSMTEEDEDMVMDDLMSGFYDEDIDDTLEVYSRAKTRYAKDGYYVNGKLYYNETDALTAYGHKIPEHIFKFY